MCNIGDVNFAIVHIAPRTVRAVSLLLFILLLHPNAEAQSDTLTVEEKRSIKLFPDHPEMTGIYIRVWKSILKLKTYVDYRNLPEVKSHCDSSLVSDQYRITLKSGLSWDMEEGPPEQPPGFFYKNLSKKGREKKEVIDRIKYLEFITACEETGRLAFEMIEKVDVYITFTDPDTSTCMVVKYEFNPLEDRKFEQSKRDIWVY